MGTTIIPAPVSGGLPSAWSIFGTDEIDFPEIAGLVNEQYLHAGTDWQELWLMAESQADPGSVYEADLYAFDNVAAVAVDGPKTATSLTASEAQALISASTNVAGKIANFALVAQDAKVRAEAQDDFVSQVCEFPTEIAARMVFTATRAGGNELRVGESGTSSNVTVTSGAAWSRLFAADGGEISLELGQSTQPGGMQAGDGKLYVRDNGAGKAQLCVIFDDFAPIVLATQA